MNWDTLKDKFGKTFLSKQSAVFVGVLILCAVMFVNFKPLEKSDCPAVLSYDEIKESIYISYCQVDSATYQLEAKDKSNNLLVQKIQYTINGNIISKSWSNPKIFINELPDYVLVSLLYNNTCFKNNTPDVSFPISKPNLENCTGYVHSSVIENSTIDNSEDSVENNPVVQDKNQEKRQENRIRHSADLNEDNTSAGKRSSTVLSENHSPKITKPQILNSSSKTIRNNSISVLKNKITRETKSPKKQNTKVEQKKIDIETPIVSSHATTANTNTSIHSESITELSIAPKRVAIKKNANKGLLFNSDTCGIPKSCILVSNRIKSDTDLFTISLKSEHPISLYDIYCQSSSNSNITLTLSQLGKPISSFSMALNKGENQIGLSSFGTLDKNQAYLLEFSTANKGDLYIFPNCSYTKNTENGMVIRYLDNHSALFGLTYENEIE